MQTQKIMYKLFLPFILIPFVSFSQTIKYRKYKAGETYRYKLTTEVYRNDKYAGKTISISEHRVVKDGEIFSEEIRWLGKTSCSAKDTVILDSIALSVIPYRISLSPASKVLLPDLSIPEMVGEITDLNTFFVAIAPALHIQKLSAKKPLFKNNEPKQGNFADSIAILYGGDCIEVTQHLLSTSRKYSIVRTNFTPPDSFCLAPLLDTVAKKTFDHRNNFQMIQRGAADKVNVFWGVESFIITTKLDNQTGAIVEAAMENFLNLRMRYNTSPDLKEYAVEMPVTIKRSLKLELMNGKTGNGVTGR